MKVALSAMQIITWMIDAEPMMSNALSSARAPDACLLFLSRTARGYCCLLRSSTTLNCDEILSAKLS